MDLVTRLATPPVKIWPCKFRTWLATLDPAASSAVLSALANRDWPDEQLLIVLTADGLDVGQSTLRTHRLGLCKGCSAS
jgi:hypothetical protein